MSDKKRFVFEAGESGYKDLQVVAIEGENTVYFSAEDEWCGSTETGFGATVGVEITRDDASRLIAMLTEWLST